MSAAFATMAALYERRLTGRGQHVQTSLLGTALVMTNPMLIEEATGARSRKPIGNRSPIAGPSDLFRTCDGWVMVQVIGDVMFERWARFVGHEELLADPRFASDIARGENGEVLSAAMADWCAQRSLDQCLRELEAAKIPACRTLSPAEALVAPENADGGFFSHQAVPVGTGTIPIASRIVRTWASDAVDGHPAPELGAHSAEVLAAIGYDLGGIAAVIGSQAVQSER
jgi:crotonobetainyl-CoA:carnitine CoA-transferase CaiB-like acyl-CoA transferase